MSKKSILKYGASMLLSAGLLLNLGSLEVLAAEKDKEDPNYFAPQDDVLSRRSIFFEQATLGAMRQATEGLNVTFNRAESTDANTRTENGYVFEKFNARGQPVPFNEDDIIHAETTTAGLTITMGSEDYLYISTVEDKEGENEKYFRGDGAHRGQLSFDVQGSDMNVVLDNLDIAALNSVYDAADHDAAGIVVYSKDTGLADVKDVNLYLVGDNEINTSAYTFDLKDGVDVSFDEVAGENGSLTMVAGTIGIRGSGGSSVAMNSGTLDITCRTSSGISMPTGSKLEVNGGNLTVLSTGSYGIALAGTAVLEMNGGELSATGTIGVCRSGEYHNRFEMNGGSAFVKGTTGVAVNVAFGTLQLDGGILSLESYIATNLYAKNFVASQGNAVLIKTGYIENLDYDNEDGSTNLLVVDMSSGQTDPYHYYYGGSSLAVPTENAEETYYGRVVGNVQLKENFTIENNVIVDIPPGNTLRHNPTNNSLTSYLSIDHYGTLRFKGVYPESGGIEESIAPFLWNKGRATPTRGDDGFGTFWIVISEDLVSDGNKGKIQNGYMEYDGGKTDFGQITIAEAGLGTFWGSGYLSVTYTGDNTGAAGSDAPVRADKYTIRIQEMGSRSLGPTGAFVKEIDHDEHLAFSAPGQAYNYFEVAPYNLKENKEGVARELTVTVDDPSALELDPTGNLTAASQALVKVKSPFDTNGTEFLTLGTDYQISTIAEDLDIDEETGDMSRAFVIEIIGIGNYTGIYEDGTTYTADQDAGMLGNTPVYIEGVAQVYIKPDGTIDLSEVEIVDANTSLALEIDDISKYITKITENEKGELLYTVRIEETPDPGDVIADTETTDSNAGVLTFTITAKKAGTGSTFSQGQLNLVSTFYERPDGKVYAEDLILTDANDTLDYGEDYDLEYWDGSTFTPWEKWVKSDIPKSDDTDRAESFTVRAIKKVDNTKTEDAVEFNVVWEVGGSVHGYDFSKGILNKYDPTNTTDKIYVVKYYGVVTSAQGLGLDVATFEVVPSDDENTPDEWTPVVVDLEDKFIDYVLSYAEFEDYIEAITTGEDAHKTQIVSNLNLDGTGTETYVDAGVGTKKWYITLQGTSPYNGQLFFEVPADKIVFVDIAEDVEGVLNNYLILDPNKFPSTPVYQKPDGTLHEEDVQLYHRLTVLDSSNEMQSVPLTVTAYQMTMKEVTVDDTADGIVVYQLDIKDTTSSSAPLKELGTTKDAVVYFDAKEAGLGDTFRHGKIDRLEESYTIDYVAPSIVEEDGTFTYTEADREKIIQQIPLTHDGAKLTYNVDYTASITMEGGLIEEGIFTFTVTGKGNGDTAEDDGTSVTFNVKIDMNYGTLSFDKNGGDDLDSTIFAPMIVESTTDTLTIPTGDGDTVPTREGYTFEGWALDDAGTHPISGVTTPLNMTNIVAYATQHEVAFADNKFTLYAIWQEEDAVEHTVKFDGNEGELGGNFPPFTELKAENSITIPDAVPTRTGYRFDGWALSADGTTKLPSDGSLKVQDLLTALGKDGDTSATITLYAQWTAVYSVTFNGNGMDLDANTYQTQNLVEGTHSSFTIPADPSRKGYRFDGWTLDQNPADGDTVYQAGSQDLATFPFPESNEVTFYAQWTAVYSVVFDGNGGTVTSPPSLSGLEVTGNIGTLPTDVTRYGYQFKGWTSDVAGDHSVADDATIGSLKANANGDHVIYLYAQWNTVYTVAFHRNLGELATDDPNNSQGSLLEGALFNKPANPTRTGFTFNGWALDAEGTGKLDQETKVEDLIATSTTNQIPVSTTINLYAVWVANSYTVTFEPKKGVFENNDDPTQTSKNYDQNVPFPKNPSLDGYNFLGWSLKDNGTKADLITIGNKTTFSDLANTVDSSGIPYEYTGSVYAVWEAKTINYIYFDYNYEGKGVTEEITNYDPENDGAAQVAIAFPLTDPTRGGYVFEGWYTDSACTAENKLVQVAGDGKEVSTYSDLNFDGNPSTATVYANWTANTYTLAFDLAGGSIPSEGSQGSTSTTWLDPIDFPSDPEKEGYTFTGWSYDSKRLEDKVSLSQLLDREPTSGATTITAMWEEVTVTGTVTYHAGNGAPSTEKTYKLTETVVLTAPSSAPEGYTFAGWFLGSEEITGTVTMEQLAAKNGYSMDVALVAKWENKPVYTVTFHEENGTGQSSTKTSISSSAPVTFPKTEDEPSYEGYTFQGWFKEKTGGTKVESGTFSELAKIKDGNNFTGNLYAQWEEDKTSGDSGENTPEVIYTVTFKYQDSKTADVVRTKTDGTVDVEFPAKPSDWSDETHDYTFKGWYTAATGGTEKGSGTFAQLTTVDQSENTKASGTLYAQWDKTEISGDDGDNTPEVNYTVTFKYQDNKTTDVVRTKTDGTVDVEFPAKPSDWSDETHDYTFKGWYTAPTGGTEKGSGTFAQLTTVDQSDNTKASGTLYAQWESTTTVLPLDVTYTLSFDYNYDNKGTFTTKESKTGSENVSVPSPNPTRTGYTFEGWYTEATCINPVTSNSKTYSELASLKVSELSYKGTLYAKWTKVEDSGTVNPTSTYVVNFYQNYGTAGILSSKTSTSGSANVTFPSNPTRSGYTFDGWSTSSSGGTKVTSGTFAQLTTAASTNYYTGDLYAQWTYNGGSSGGTDSEDDNSGGNNDSGDNNGSGSGGSSSGGSSSGGSSSGGSSSGGSSSGNSNTGSTVPDVSVNNDVAGDRVTVDLLLKPNVSGTQLNTTVTGDAMSDALSQAGSNKDYDVTITPDYSGTTAGKDYDFTLDRDALEAFSDSNAATLTVLRDDVIITFDKAAVNHILDNTLHAVIVSVDNKNLSSSAAAAFGNRPSYELSITDSAGNSLANLGDGVMKITLPFTANSTEQGGNLIAGRVNYYGDVEYQVKSYYNGEGMLILSDKLGVYGITLRENTSVFTNLNSHWSEEYARFTDARRLYAEINNVDLNDQITRADFVTIVGIIQGIDVSKQNNPDFFHDVNPSAYYAPYVQWAFENNVSAGKLDGYFDPDAEINREEMATMLLAYIRSMNKELEVINGQKKFTDEDVISKWAEDAVQYVQTLGLIYGKDDDYFDPKGVTTFGDHAVMMMRLIESIVNIHTVYLGE